MVKVVQVVKKLNNTELGKGNTHEYYIYVPQFMEVNDIFFAKDRILPFVYKGNGKKYDIRYIYTRSNEKRIVGLGDFYREIGASAGDEIMIEMQEWKGDLKYFLDFNSFSNVILAKKYKKGFEILNEDRVSLIQPNQTVNYLGEHAGVSVIKISEERKRKDSPALTNIFDVVVGGKSIVDQIGANDVLEITVLDGNHVLINKSNQCSKYVFEVGDI